MDGTGGAGADVVGQLPVSTGEVLYVEVAARGFDGGGFGGDALEGGLGGSGGSASDLRTVSKQNPNRSNRVCLWPAAAAGRGRF